jgi:hypothetical protein
MVDCASTIAAMNRLLSLVVVLCLAVSPLHAAKETRVSWQELASRIQGKTVALVLPDGVHVQGQVADVRSDALKLNVSKTSDKHLHPKGEVTLPRASVRNLTYWKRGYVWTVVGTAIGLGAGLAGGSAVNTYAHNEGDGAPGIVAAIIILPAVLGFFLGRSGDRKSVNIVVTD